MPKRKVSKTKANSSKPAFGASPAPAHTWTFLTNHSHVLLCLAEDAGVRLRDVAVRVGITERAVQKIVADLEEGGVVQRSKDGRRNHYAIDARRPLRHPIESHRTVESILAMLRK